MKSRILSTILPPLCAVSNLNACCKGALKSVCCKLQRMNEICDFSYHVVTLVLPFKGNIMKCSSIVELSLNTILINAASWAVFDT